MDKTREKSFELIAPLPEEFLPIKPETDDNVVDLEKEQAEKANLNLCKKMKLIFTNITVEPIMVCYILPSVMASIATQNLTLEKSCRVNLHLDEAVCNALSAHNESAYENYKQDEMQVQKLATSMAIWKNVIQSIIPSILLLFLGSWSDRHKRRKPCILNPILGEIATCTGFLICTYFFYQLPMEVNVFFEAVPPAVAGGWFSMLMGVFSFISGVSSVEARTLRIGAVNMFINVSICIGIALSGILYEKIGFYGVYSVAIIMYLIGLLYGIFFVKETINIEDANDENNDKSFKKKETTSCYALRDFFDVQHVVETFKVAFKKGERNRRMRIFLIMILVMVIVGPLQGELNVLYMFCQYKFGWDAVDYSLFYTFQFIINIIGTLFALYFFTKFLKVDDTVLGMVSSLSKILSAFVYALAPTPFVFFFGALAEALNGTSFIAMRSIVSKLVPQDELGKINSLFGLCEAIVPLIYGPLYSIVYAKTINIFPGAFFIVGGVLTVPSVFIFIWLYFEHKRDERELEAKTKKEPEKIKLIK